MITNQTNKTHSADVILFEIGLNCLCGHSVGVLVADITNVFSSSDTPLYKAAITYLILPLSSSLRLFAASSTNIIHYITQQICDCSPQSLGSGSTTTELQN